MDGAPEVRQDLERSYQEVPATSFDQICDKVYEMLRREFGSAGEVEEIQRDQRASIFGFTVDGVGYSLGVNVTP